MYICFYFCCVNLVETVLPSVCSEFSLSVFWNGIDFYIINVSLYRDVFFSMQRVMPIDVTRRCALNTKKSAK
jgi:hypothetical protein